MTLKLYKNYSDKIVVEKTSHSQGLTSQAR